VWLLYLLLLLRHHHHHQHHHHRLRLLWLLHPVLLHQLLALRGISRQLLAVSEANLQPQFVVLQGLLPVKLVV
jgi:RsiW-degrading membrane proteinase PrsW (M82 family)